MKVKSKAQLLDLIQQERSWRRKELTNIKGIVHQSREAYSHTVIRGAILLLYSHWEGYVKKVCEIFFYYLNSKGYKYSVLTNNLKALGIFSQFKGQFPYKKFNSYLKATNFVLDDCEHQKFNLDVEKHVDTNSNLNTEVLNDLLDKIGVDASYFDNNKFHIDTRLLRYRNSIAHGERTDNNPELYVSKEDFYNLYGKVNNYMDHFEALVINHVELETYKVAEFRGHFT